MILLFAGKKINVQQGETRLFICSFVCGGITHQLAESAVSLFNLYPDREPLRGVTPSQGFARLPGYCVYLTFTLHRSALITSIYPLTFTAKKNAANQHLRLCHAHQLPQGAWPSESGSKGANDSVGAGGANQHNT